MRQVIILDTETTGVTPADEILQLSIVNSRKEILLNEYYKPKKHNEWPGAQQVHHISPLDVIDKPNILEQKKQIEKIINDSYIIVGYNVQFDIRMLKQNGIEIPEDIRIIDIMQPFAKIYGDYDPARKNYKWQKLETCAKYYGNQTEGYHNSLEDCLATLHCFKMMYFQNQLNELYYQPIMGQNYWTLCFNSTELFPGELQWNGNQHDVKNKALGICYPTKELCEQNLKADFQKIAGKSYEEFKKQ